MGSLSALNLSVLANISIPKMVKVKMNSSRSKVNELTYLRVIAMVLMKKLKVSQVLASLKTLISLKILNT
jgi:hypothetical protein